MSSSKLSAPNTRSKQLVVTFVTFILFICILVGIIKSIGYFTDSGAVEEVADVTALMFFGLALQLVVLVYIIATIYRLSVVISTDFALLNIDDLTEIQALSYDNAEIKKYVDAVIKQRRDLYGYDLGFIRAYSKFSHENIKLNEVRASLGFTE